MTAIADDSDDVPCYPMRRTCPMKPPTELGCIRGENEIRRVRIWDGSQPWLITRYPEAREALADPRLSSRADQPGFPGTSAALSARNEATPTFVTLDDPEHARLRRTVAAPFTGRRIEATRAMVREVVNAHLDALEHAHHGQPSVDLVASFALPVPAMIICRLLGVPLSGHVFFQETSLLLADTTSDPHRSLEANEVLSTYLGTLISDRHENPTDDVLGHLAHSVTTREITPAEASQTALLLLISGLDPTAHMIALGMLHLLTNPDQAAHLRAGTPEQVSRGVEELLRLLTVIHLGRRRAAVADVQIGDTTIRAGDGVIIALDAANRDPAVFHEPDHPDLERARNHHLAFGHGAHQCLGKQLARLTLQETYPALLRRFPTLRVPLPIEQLQFRDDKVVYGPAHLPVTW